MIGTKIQLKKSHAKWHLDHLDIYFFGGLRYDSYDSETMIHLMCCLGVPVRGRIIKKGALGCWLAKFKVAGVTMEYYIDRRHFDISTNTSKMVK